MKALKEFDYNLWTTEENGVKKYFVGVKATGEVTEVDAEVMKVLRNEEKKMRRHIEEEGDGSFLTYHAPYGYRWDGQRLVVVPEEAEVVKKIYELYLSGNGVSRITSFLNKKGFTVGKEQWNSNRVRYILGNEKYTILY